MNRLGVGLGDTLVTPRQFKVQLGSAIASTPVDHHMARGLNESIGENSIQRWHNDLVSVGADTLFVEEKAVDTHAIAPYLLKRGLN